MTSEGRRRVQDNAIRALLLSNTDHEFSLPSLISFFLLFYGLAIVTTGVAVPSGLFVPCILCGASYGRAVGFLMTEIYPVRVSCAILEEAVPHSYAEKEGGEMLCVPGLANAK
jgi:H+/Cl- antiporter ClcA